MNRPAPMRIAAFGVILRRLARDDIERVRQWRNSPEVNRHMVFREAISPAMQERWFASLDPIRDYYYVIETNGRAVGLTNLKGFNPLTQQAEGGIFIGEQGEQDGTIGLAAILAMYDFGFEELDLKAIKAQILDDNARAIRFNRALGFRRLACVANELHSEWILERQDYVARTASIRPFLASASPNHGRPI